MTLLMIQALILSIMTAAFNLSYKINNSALTLMGGCAVLSLQSPHLLIESLAGNRDS
jgi:hypothetical protein